VVRLWVVEESQEVEDPQEAKLNNGHQHLGLCGELNSDRDDADHNQEDDDADQSGPVNVADYRLIAGK